MQPLGFLDQLVLLDRPLEESSDDARLYGFFEEPECLQIVHKRNRLIHAAETGEDHRGGPVTACSQFLEQGDSIHAGHYEIGEDGACRFNRQSGERLVTIGSSGDLIAKGLDYLSQVGSLLCIVVHD